VKEMCKRPAFSMASNYMVEVTGTLMVIKFYDGSHLFVHDIRY